MAEQPGGESAMRGRSLEGSQQMQKEGDQRREQRAGHPSPQNVLGENVMEQSLEEQQLGQSWLERDRKGAHAHEYLHLPAPAQSRLDPALQEDDPQALAVQLREAQRRREQPPAGQRRDQRREEW